MLQSLALPLLLATADSNLDPSEEATVLAPISVTAQRVANLAPAAGFSTAATALRFDPLVNLQARGLPEAQADVTVRGGLFENTGFRLGAVTLIDPQTGHYAVEIPLDPGMLGKPDVLTDFDNGLNAFNASVATVQYVLAAPEEGGALLAGLGSDSVFYATGRLGFGPRTGASAGALAFAYSGGDGTLPNGDHDFRRVSGQYRWLGANSETQLLLGYHDKFMGWPGMYTGFASLPETDHVRLGLGLLDHRWTTSGGWWNIGAAWRWLEDDYDFDRRTPDSGGPGSFEHETRSFSLGLAGRQAFAGLDWRVSGQFTADRLVRSTDLVFGDFNSRSYGSVAVAPGFEWSLSSGVAIETRAGLRADFSNRDENAVSPILQLSLARPFDGGTDRYDIQYTRNTQIPGYTALKSPPVGLFGGNAGLGRSYASTLTVGWSRAVSAWTFQANAFLRRDDDLVDWTWREGAPYVRRANPVDIDVGGVEALLTWEGATLKLITSWAWLDKDADYGDSDIDASYYALNFARHRFTLAATWQPAPTLQFRLDNEYRVQQANPLRTSGDRAYLGALSAAWQPGARGPWRLQLVIDNLADSDFQEFPGTPPMGRQFSLGVILDW